MKQQGQGSMAVNRRSFLKNSGIAGVSLAGAAMVAGKVGAFDQVSGARKLGLGSTAAHAAGLSPADIEVLQFALNLEYLEGEFYSFAVTGKSLQDNGIGIDGIVGNPGPTTGGAKVPFKELHGKGPIRAIAEQLMRDELNHVLLIRSILGPEFTIAKPAINLGAVVAMNTLQGFLTLARDFEATGTSAYGGAVGLIDQTILQTAVQIGLVEALHLGNLQLLVDLNEIPISPLDVLDIVPPPTGNDFFPASFDQGLAVIRNTNQVMAIAYG
ncbi:MAG TPA: ferritin-like domain-containing protein, partial [Acidobacteriaceae bacterium]